MVQPINISNVLSSLEYLGQANRIRSEREEREKAKKGGVGGTIGGIAGTAAGAYFGKSPAAAAAGGVAGSYIGAKIAGGDASGQQIASSGMQGYQMGQQQQQQQNNRKFNITMAENIESDPKATMQQKQFVTYLKTSDQAPEVTMKQAEYIGVEQEKRDQRAILTDINTGTIEKGKNYYKELQSSYEPDTPQYIQLQKKMDRLVDLENKNIGSVQPQTIESYIRSDMPKRTRVYTDEDTGLVMAETIDPFSGDKNLSSLGKSREGVYKIPYYENGVMRIKNTTNQEEAIRFADEKGTEVIEPGKSIMLTNLAAASKASNKKDIEYLVSTDVLKRKDAITERLTKKGVTGETIRPSENQVDIELRNELEMLSRTVTGEEKGVIQEQYKAVDAKVKENTTQEFIAILPQLSPDIETTKKNIELVRKTGAPKDVDRRKALAALEELKKTQELQEKEKQQKEAEVAKQEELKNQNKQAPEISNEKFNAILGGFSRNF